MMRLAWLAFFLAMVVPASAQNAPTDFPLDKTFKGVSISGFDVQKQGLTLTVTRDRASNRLVASGSTGCNNWTANVVIREDQVDVAEIIATKKHCSRGMKTEEAFLTTLKSAHRWRVDGQRLILEGEAARLLLTAGAPDRRSEVQSDNKPATKPARPQASR
jgi:heat shock protein HslJ